jgi:hypothetical protein
MTVLKAAHIMLIPYLIRKKCSVSSLVDVSDCRSNRRGKPSIIMKDPNISFNLTG